MSDLIYRQAAIDAIVEHTVCDTKRELVERCDANISDENGWLGGVCIALDTIEDLPPAHPEQRWIPCSERLPEEDYWMGGTGKQFSATVLVTVSNREDEDEFVDTSYTVDGEWMLELPRYCKIVAWMPLPEPWKGEQK